MQNLPPEIIDKIYSYTNTEICIRDKKYYALKKFPEVTMTWASEGGHLEVVKYLHSKGETRDADYAFHLAASNGHLEIVKYLHEEVGEKCTTIVMCWAAVYGHLEIVKYLHSQGVAYVEVALILTDANEHYELAEYLRSNGVQRSIPPEKFWIANMSYEDFLVNCYTR